MKDVSFLIVDDSSSVRKTVGVVIKNKLGANKIFEAGDGARAIEMLKSAPIDIIISDWKMPNVTGEKLLHHVRNNEKLKDIPFIMMSSFADQDFIVKAIQQGVTHFIVKPFSPLKLEDAIRKSWNNAKKRKVERYANLPKHKLTVKIDVKSFSAQVTNISRDGVLIEADYCEEIKLFSKCELSLEFEKIGELGAFAISSLQGTVVRLEAEDTLNPDSKCCRVALCFSTGIITKEVKKNMDALLKYLGSLDPEVIKDE